jgi:thymidylate synthase (FAD)
MIKSANSVYQSYASLIEKGVKNEVARMVLPVNIMTTFVWTVNLRSLFNFLHQRLDEHAQYEIRYLAGEVEKIFAESFPVTYKYWKEFRK